jgi:putative transposase
LRRPIESTEYRVNRYVERHAAHEAVVSVDPKGNSNRNANPWRDINHLEVAVAEWVD